MNSSFSSTPVLVEDDPPSPEVSGPSETLDADNNGVFSSQDNSEPSTSSSNSNVAESELILQSSEALVKGISFFLGSLIKDFDCKAEDTVKSQDQLCSAIDRLSRELDQLLENAPLPFVMHHAAKITGVRKRVSSLNSLLKLIQRGIDDIDRMLSAGLSHGPSNIIKSLCTNLTAIVGSVVGEPVAQRLSCTIATCWSQVQNLETASPAKQGVSCIHLPLPDLAVVVATCTGLLLIFVADAILTLWLVHLTRGSKTLIRNTSSGFILFLKAAVALRLHVDLKEMNRKNG
ncbi:uncharacterized protein LOC122071642 [Macadamia integrifolia]|uniref:uncharacterized protein LOC122071642 n=1 Tax=Macadamia integrifolia TaxID=60698 RepID=UPI001C4F92EB|nr:uncharacterized protein LOC122071642 [Macadamia integrifolia]